MHPLHEYVAKQLADKIRIRNVVVWYDEKCDFAPFIIELRGSPIAESASAEVSLLGKKIVLAEYNGSMFDLRLGIEPYVEGDSPAPVIAYIPGRPRDRRASVLMEIEKAGASWEPQLKQLAKSVLLQKYTLGVVDEILPFDRSVSYEDITRAVSGSSGSEPPSILKSIYHEANGNDALLVTWLASSDLDEEITHKEATPELRKLIRARLGLEIPEDAQLEKIRAITSRYILAAEFRLDLLCPPPVTLEGIPTPQSEEEEGTIRILARGLRANFADAYSQLADRIENELCLRNAKLPPRALGTIDTFRFEERELLGHATSLIADTNFAEALDLVVARQTSFWLDRDVVRKAQWEAVRRMAELGSLAFEVRANVGKPSGTAAAWFDAYTSDNGWYRLDQAQRRLETWVANLDEEPEERALGVVRREYEDTCHAMAEGFTKALNKAGWTVPRALHQTRIFSEIVSERPKPVAFFLVDAMRFEMGRELAERLPRNSEVSIQPAIAALPSITPLGMAALMPGASASYSVIEKKGSIGAEIEGTFLPDLTSRKKFASSRLPKLVDFSLNELLSLQASKLAKKTGGAQIVIIRSQEIDHAGEAGFTYQARQIMDNVIDNLSRAIRKLSAAGIEHSVVTADHGHLFFPTDRNESMRTDAPGGNTVELHRRCWIGRGGTTPPGCVRISASDLGYASDLEFVFPAGSGVFRAGGNLAFHHGGPSLQELVVPVVTVRTTSRDVPKPSEGPVLATGLPDVVTNRIFSVTLSFGGKEKLLFAEDIVVRPLLMADGKQVGIVGMAVNAQLDRTTGCVILHPNKPVTVAFLLSDENVSSLRVVVQDPSTDAELYRSPNDISVRLGV